MAIQQRARVAGRCEGRSAPSAIITRTPTHGRQVWLHPVRPVRTARAKVAELVDAGQT